MRRFAPFHSFGGGYEGDAASRGLGEEGSGGHTTALDATSRTSASVEIAGSTALPFAEANATSHPLYGTATAGVEKELTFSAQSDREGQFELLSAGSMPLTLSNVLNIDTQGPFAAPPLFAPVAPDIDTGLNLRYAMDGDDLVLEGAVWGDRFPSAEVFLTDPQGASVMLLEFDADAWSGPMGPYTHLFGSGSPKSPLGTFRATVPVDESGGFLASPWVEFRFGR